MGNARSFSRNELTMLHEALETAAKWMQWWLDENECDCDAGHHICGRPEREEELNKIQAAKSRLLDEEIKKQDIEEKIRAHVAAVAKRDDKDNPENYFSDYKREAARLTESGATLEEMLYFLIIKMCRFNW